MKLPWVKWFVADWITDHTVTMCGPSTRAIWFDWLCHMLRSDSYTVSGNPRQLAALARCTADEADAAAHELERCKTAEVHRHGDTITVISRRLRREVKTRESNAEAQRRMRERGGGDPERWTAIRAPILVRDKKVCAYCGRKATTVDHIQPKSRGGGEESWNLVACCKPCNTRKNNRTPEEAGMSFWLGFDRSVLVRRDAAVMRESVPIDSEPDTDFRVEPSEVPPDSKIYPASHTLNASARVDLYPLHICAGVANCYPRGRLGQPHKAAKAVQGALQRICADEDHPGYGDPLAWLQARALAFAASPAGKQGQYTPMAHTWFDGGGYDAPPESWRDQGDKPAPRTAMTWDQCVRAVARGHPTDGSFPPGAVRAAAAEFTRTGVMPPAPTPTGASPT